MAPPVVFLTLMPNKTQVVFVLVIFLVGLTAVHAQAQNRPISESAVLADEYKNAQG